MYNNSVYITKFPNPSELLCLFATINYENDKISCFNQVILKCRQLIFEIPEIIAYPHTKQMLGIYIVVKEEFYKTGFLKTYLDKHSIRSGPPQAVQKYIFEKCVSYTIISKLAPKWNQISNYLVCGRNFLTNEYGLDSVQLKFNINDGNATIFINVNRVKISKITLDNLYLTDDELKELKTYQCIQFKECNIRSVQVLPSLKRGKIIALHLKLNNKCSIKTYQEMKRYWKNTYGYRLPDSDEDNFYVDICFFGGSQIFTYPNLCVGFCEPISIQYVDSHPVIASFLTSLKKYVPTILGENYPIPSNVNKPTDNILRVSQMVSLPKSCEINTKTKEAISDENKIIQNETEPKSKLSQLLEELNKTRNKSTIFLTPNLTKNIDIDDFETPSTSKTLSIAESLNAQIDFLNTSISQRANALNNSTPNFTNNFNFKKYKNITTQDDIELERDFVSPNNEDMNTPIKKRKMINDLD